MPTPFIKMQGLGNDFVVFDGVARPVFLTSGKIRRLADRRFGVGCDQVLLIEPATGGGADFRYRIFNADGAEAEQCGNGARCVARFVHDRGLAAGREVVFETLAGPVRTRLEDDGRVSVDMGAPRLDPAQVPFEAPRPQLVYDLEVNGEAAAVSVLSMGNPHAVQVVPEVDAAPVHTQGPKIERHRRFPKRVNAGYMQVVDRRRIRLRVWERGVGETLACGTGACAAVVAGRLRGLLDDTVEVQLPGGVLAVSWAGGGSPVWLTGPAETVFEGTIDLDRL
jgi:diaminopimelate epimerase